MDGDRRRRRYVVVCEAHGELSNREGIVGAYAASILIDKNKRFVLCDKAVASPAPLRQRTVRRMAR